MTERSCPQCGKSVSVDPAQPGVAPACPHCGASLPPAPPPPAAVARTQPADGRGKGLAVTALVLGAIGLIPPLGILLGLVAVILGIVSLATRRPGKGMALAGTVLGGIGLVLIPTVALLVLILLPSLGRARELARQAVCMTNLRSVGQAVEMYMHANGGIPPADPDAMIRASLLEHRHFECPSVGTPGTVDYFYMPPPPRRSTFGASSGPPRIVACDLRGNHIGGRNTRSRLLSDTSVEHLEEADFQAELRLPQNAAFAAALRAAEGP